MPGTGAFEPKKLPYCNVKEHPFTHSVTHNPPKNIFILRNDLPYQTLEILSSSCVEEKDISSYYIFKKQHDTKIETNSSVNKMTYLQSE